LSEADETSAVSAPALVRLQVHCMAASVLKKLRQHEEEQMHL
jgi:hypothetical protein